MRSPRTPSGPAGGASDALFFYTRPHCELCDEAMRVVEPVALRLGIPVVIRNVEDREDWESRFGAQVPVGVYRARRIFKYRVEPGRLERSLRAP